MKRYLIPFRRPDGIRGEHVVKADTPEQARAKVLAAHPGAWVGEPLPARLDARATQ